MKLKIILMPVSVIISIVLIIWHIYPTWFGELDDSIKTSREEIKKEEAYLSEIRTKKSNSQQLSQSLSGNEEMKNLIDRYYPTFRNDEDMVNNINNIAFTEGVFLSKMEVEYKSMTQSDNPVALMSLPFDESKYANMQTIAADGSVMMGVNAEGTSFVDEAKQKIKYVQSSLEIYGTYEQIKKFIASLNNTGLLNKIQYFNVRKEESKQAIDAELLGGNVNAGDVLYADIEVGFGYLIARNEKAENLLKEPIFSRSSFDFSPVNEKKEILMGVYKQSEVGEIGNASPFAGEIDNE